MKAIVSAMAEEMQAIDLNGDEKSMVQIYVAQSMRKMADKVLTRPREGGD